MYQEAVKWLPVCVPLRALLNSMSIYSFEVLLVSDSICKSAAARRLGSGNKQNSHFLCAEAAL